MLRFSFRPALAICLSLFGACVTSSSVSEEQRGRTRVLLDSDANNEVNDQHDIAYMAAVAIVRNPAWAHPVRIPAPRLVGRKWVLRPRNPRSIVLWESFDRAASLADVFASMDGENP